MILKEWNFNQIAKGYGYSSKEEYIKDLIVKVYECHEDIDGMGNPTGTYSTDTTLEHFLKEVK